MPTDEIQCEKCGQCCYETRQGNGFFFKTGVPCEYLNTKTHLCTVYDNRFLVNPRCLTLVEAAMRHALPAECPFTENIPNYQPPLRLQLT